MDVTVLMDDYVVPWGIKLAMAVLIFFIGRIIVGVLVRLSGRLLERAKVDMTLVRFLKDIVHAVLMLFVIVASLDQLGVDTTSLVALLGAAGLAIGLALQGSLQNFAAGVMLVLFRPFKVGDVVSAGGADGKVEAIGIFSTTLKTGDNRMIILPNGSIYSGMITNITAMETRRIDMVFGIGYGDDLRQAKALIESILADDARILKDPAPLVAVAELGDSSVNFNVRPWVARDDYWAVYFDLNERIKLAFDEAGISIPFPQMDVHLIKEA